MSKGLEALEEIKKCMAQNCDYAEYYKEFETIEKELKALEIIREKKVDTYAIMIYANWELEDYNHVNYHKLTQEEYDLLKEVLL